MDDFDWYTKNKHAGNPVPFDSEKRDAHLRIAELLQAAIVFKNYADDRYNKDPRSCAIINTPIQQRLWLAIDAVREGKGCIDAIPDTRLAIAVAALQSISEYWRCARTMTDACEHNRNAAAEALAQIKEEKK